MGIVSGIEIARKRAAVYVDGTLFIRVTEGDLRALPLREGEAVEEQEYMDRLCALQAKRAYEAALTMLEKRDMTTGDMKRALVRRLFLPEVAESVAARLIENRLLDDERYAKRFVERKSAGEAGKWAVREKLRAKGVERDVVEDALEALDDDQQLGAAKALAAKLARKYEGLPPREAKAKLSQAVARRGFSWDVVSEAVSLALPDDD